MATSVSSVGCPDGRKTHHSACRLALRLTFLSFRDLRGRGGNWWRRNDSIRTLARTPIVGDLLEVAEPPRCQAIAAQAVKLRGLGYPDSLIAECTDVMAKTVAKAVRWYMNR